MLSAPVVENPDADADATAPRTLQERFESSDVGRIILSGFLVFTVMAVFIWNMPPSEIKTRLDPVFRPYVVSTGLDQGWDVFSPVPRRNTVDFFARISYDDGSRIIWRRPDGNRVIGTYRTYRWQKWMEFVMDDAHASLRRPAAVWIARQNRRPEAKIASVELVRLWYTNPPPGGKPGEHPDFVEEVFYTARSAAAARSR